MTYYKSSMKKTCFPSTNRISITLADHVYQKLVERAAREGRSVSNLAAYLLERALDTGDTY